MKRRNFLKLAAAAGAAAALPGCRLVAASRAAGPAAALPARPLFAGGPPVSLLGFGSHTTPELLARHGEREAHLRLAVEQGVTFFDIYPNPRGGPSTYKAGMAAPALDAFRRAIPPRADVRVSMMMPASMADLEDALRRLGRDRLDAVRLFWGDPPRPEREAHYETMARAQQQGKVRAIGLAGHTEADLADRLERHPYDFAMAIYNFHETWQHYPVLTPWLRKRGASLIAMKCMGRGSLLAVARQAGLPPDDVAAAALRFVWQNPAVSLALPSMFTAAEVRANVAAARRPALGADEAQLLERLSAAAGARCRSMTFET